jgi:hypothetical protein
LKVTPDLELARCLAIDGSMTLQVNTSQPMKP